MMKYFLMLTLPYQSDSNGLMQWLHVRLILILAMTLSPCCDATLTCPVRDLMSMKLSVDMLLALCHHRSSKSRVTACDRPTRLRRQYKNFAAAADERSNGKAEHLILPGLCRLQSNSML